MLSVSFYNSNFFDRHCIATKTSFEKALRQFTIYQIFHALLKHDFKNFQISGESADFQDLERFRKKMEKIILFLIGPSLLYIEK